MHTAVFNLHDRKYTVRTELSTEEAPPHRQLPWVVRVCVEVVNKSKMHSPVYNIHDRKYTVRGEVVYRESTAPRTTPSRYVRVYLIHYICDKVVAVAVKEVILTLRIVAHNHFSNCIKHAFLFKTYIKEIVNMITKALPYMYLFC